MSRLDSHVSAVQRKLVLGSFIEWAAMAVFVLGVLALLLVAMQKLFLHLPINNYWLWSGAGLLGACVVAAVMAFVHRPSRGSAAVAIDRKLGLNEKFSTALHVRGVSDPFAKAVVMDAERTAEKVQLAGQFPLGMPKFTWLALGAILLAFVAARFVPNDIDLFGRKEAAKKAEQKKIEFAQAQQIVKETIAQIEAMPKAIQNQEAMKIAKADLERALTQHNVPDTGKANRMKIDAMAKADEAMKKQVDAFKQEMKTQNLFNNMASRSLNPPVDAKGPVADAQRKLAAGKYDEAIKELEKVSKEWDKMNKDEQKEAEKQFEALAAAAKKMAEDPRVKKEVEKQLQQAGLNQQQIQQAQQLAQQAANGNQQAAQQLQQMAQQAMQGMNQQQQQQMQQAVQQAMQGAQQQAQAGAMGQAAQQMAQAMQQAQQAQANGNQQGGQQAQQQMQGAQQAMQNAAAGLQQMQQQNQMAQNQMNQMQQQQQNVQQQMAQAGGQLNGQPGQQGQGQQPGQGQGQQPGQGNQPGNGGQGQFGQGDPQNKQGNGQGGPGQGQGGQGAKTPSPFAMKQEVSPSDYNEKGAHIASIQVKDKSIRGDARLQLEKVLSAGDAGEADEVDDTRANRRAQEVQKKYFQVMQDELKK